MLFQIAVLFLLGVVLIAVISFFALDALSEKYVRDQLSIRERGTAQDLVRYINECPMLMEPGEYFELVDDRHGFVLGADPDGTYHEYTLQMKPGSKLFLYTDGLIEAVNKHDQMFETYRVLAALNRARDETKEKIPERVKEEQAAFVGGGPPFDDLTMLCLHYISPRPEIEKSGEDADIDS